MEGGVSGHRPLAHGMGVNDEIRRIGGRNSHPDAPGPDDWARFSGFVGELAREVESRKGKAGFITGAAVAARPYRHQAAEWCPA